MALAVSFAPARPTWHGTGLGVRDKAEVCRLLGEYVDVLADSKALGTWTSYAPHWADFRYWVALTVGPFYSFQQLADFKWLPRAYGMHLWEVHEKTDTVLEKACSAINLGFEQQGCARIMNDCFVTAIKAAKRRRRKKPTKRSLATQRWMLKALITEWWLKPRAAGRRVDSGRLLIIIWTFWSTMTMARFADASRFFWEAVWFIPGGKGILVTVDKRKNRQNHSGSQLMMGFSDSIFSVRPLILEYLKRCGGSVDKGGYVVGATGRVFRPLVRRTTKKVNGVVVQANYTHVSKVRYGACLKSSGKIQYPQLLRWFRAALMKVCGFTKDEVMLFGTHACRRGGNNTAQDEKIAGNVVLALGEWAALSSQRVYNERDLSEQLKTILSMAF